jgi:anti-anti-sigma factor
VVAELEIQPSPGLRSFRVRGELDLATSETLIERLGVLAEGADGDLRLEVSGLAFVDSTGLHALVRLARAMPQPHRLVLLEPSPSLCRLLELTGLDGVTQIEVRRSEGV